MLIRSLGGLGACPPGYFWHFRPSEIVSGAILGEIANLLLFVYSPRSKGVAPLRRNCDFARMYIALVLNKNVNLNRAHYTTQRAKTPLLALRSKLPFRKAKCFQTAWRRRDSAMVQVRWVQLDS